MGSELQTTLTYNRKTSAGKALLETSELIFRGDVRLKIPFATIKKLDVRDGDLRVTFDGGAATFHLGPQAQKWADKIRNPKSRIDKLGVKPGQRVVVINIKDRDFVEELAARTAPISRGRVVKDADVIFLGADTLAALDRIASLVPYLKPGGAIWTVTPKGKGGIKDTDIMAKGKAAGLVDVKVVSFSDTHSANKFVIPKSHRRS